MVPNPAASSKTAASPQVVDLMGDNMPSNSMSTPVMGQTMLPMAPVMGQTMAPMAAVAPLPSATPAGSKSSLGILTRLAAMLCLYTPEISVLSQNKENITMLWIL